MDWAGRAVNGRSWESMKDGGRICRCLCCCGPLLFFIIWIIDAICGAIYYDAWSPRFDLEDVHVILFNITPAYRELGGLELNYEMQFYVRARRFSRIHSIEKFSYRFTTLYNGFMLGESHVSAPRPLILDGDKTCVVNSTQLVQHLPLEFGTWSSLQHDMRDENLFLLQIEIQGQVKSGLFWCLKKVKTRVCEVSVGASYKLLSLTCNDR